mmetsp:Transcript_22488/g.46363  ORF Transcript_22488/g.46363 Transcript_22488/m.46363 type:complete len:505 (+) Transcript_22488:36-1550(+)
MVHPNTRRSTALLVLVALAHVAHHSFVVAPFPALRVHCSVRPSGITKTRVLRQVGANQHWPYGLVGDEKSYARQVDGNFFADVKNSSFFLKALKEDAGEKQVDADAHLKTVRLNAKKFMQGNTIVDRESFIQSLTDAIFEDGLLTLVLGGKSVGKSLVVSYVADKVRQAQGSSRTVVLANLRRGGETDFYQAVFGAAAEQQGLAEKLPSLFKEVVTMASGLVAAAENLNAATAPLAASVRSIIGIMQPEQKALTFSKLVKSIQETGNDTTIIIDEANLALPNDGNDAKAETAKTALAQITGETKEAFKASVVLISSEHGYPFKLAKAGLNLVDIKNIVIAPEVPPRDMFEMLTDHWGMGHRLARLFVATYGGSIDAVYTALGNLMNKGDQFYPLGTTSVPGIGNCMVKDDAREHLINIALDGFSPVSNLKQDEGAQMASEENVAGIIPGEAQAPGLWPDAFHETEKKYVLVASTHHVRLLICEALLDEGYIQNNGGNLARVSPR